MKKCTITINSPSGIHAKPASKIVETASKFSCTKILIIKENEQANAKSILSILGLGAGQNTVLEIQAEGGEEELALKTITELIENLME